MHERPPEHSDFFFTIYVQSCCFSAYDIYVSSYARKTSRVLLTSRVCMYIFLYHMCMRRFLFMTFVYIFLFPISDIYVRICTKRFKSAEFPFQYTCTCMSVFIIHAYVSLFSACDVFMLLYVRKAPRDLTSFFIACVYVCLFSSLVYIHISFFII